jgi:hypothetical protein
MSPATGTRIPLAEARKGVGPAPYVRREVDQSARPLCMEPDDYTDWASLNGSAGSQQASSPCFDCPRHFATEMRAIGRCNGHPRGEEPEPALRPAIQRAAPAQKETRHMALTVTRVLVSAPCANCAHEPVCGRKPAIDALAGQMDIESDAKLPAGLAVAIAATVDCDALLPLKKSHKATGPADDAPKARIWTDEQRAAQAERLRAMNAAKRAPLGNVTGQPIRQLEAAE